MMKKSIKLERIEKQDDYSFFAQLAFNKKVMIMNMGRVFTQDEAVGYFSYILEYNHANENAGSYKVFSENGSVFIGIGNLWAREDGAEVEYMVLPEYWNQGYATEIVKALVETARKNPGIAKVSGIIDPANLPSKKVLLKNGFVFETTRYIEEDDSAVEVYSRETAGV